jgi:hypothetical protein
MTLSPPAGHPVGATPDEGTGGRVHSLGTRTVKGKVARVANPGMAGGRRTTGARLRPAGGAAESRSDAGTGVTGPARCGRNPQPRR